MVSLFTGTRTHVAVSPAALPVVASAALWWTAVRQAPEPQPYSDDAAPVIVGNCSRLARPPGFELHIPRGAGSSGNGGVWPHKAPGAHRKGSDSGSSCAGGGIGAGGSSNNDTGVEGRPQGHGLVVLKQQVQVVGPLDAETMINDCLQVSKQKA